MKIYEKISTVGVIALIATASFFGASKNAWACTGASCEGLDPAASGCEADATTLGYANLYRCEEGLICDWDDTHPYLGSVEFFYSPTCNATWAWLYGMSRPPAGGAGWVSMNIVGKKTTVSHSISRRIDSSIAGSGLYSVLVEDWGAEVCVDLHYVKFGSSGYDHDDYGCFLPPKETITTQPNFHVVALTYSAPGKQSIVTYGATSSAGTETSTSSSFKSDFSVSTNVLGVSLSGGLSTNRSSSDSVQVTRNTTLAMDVRSFTDPIDHGNDLFWVWVNPQVDITVTPGQAPLEWILRADSSGYARVLPLSVYNAIDPSTILAGYKPFFAKLTREDYDAILSLNPYVDVATRTIRSPFPVATSARFEATPYTLPLDGRIGVNLKNVDSKSIKRTDSFQTSIEAGISGGISIFKHIFKSSAKFTWTFAASRSSTWNTSQSAEVNLKTPSTTFAGVYDVYFDRLFGTFLLVDASPTPIRFTGMVRDARGNPLVDERVILRFSDGSQRITYTDGEGRYRFHNLPEGTSTIEVRGERRSSHTDQAHPVTVDFGAAPKL